MKNYSIFSGEDWKLMGEEEKNMQNMVKIWSFYLFFRSNLGLDKSFFSDYWIHIEGNIFS